MPESSFALLEGERYGHARYAWLTRPPELVDDVATLRTRDNRVVSIRLADGRVEQRREPAILTVHGEPVSLPGFFPSWDRGPESLGDGAGHGVRRVHGTLDAEAVARELTDFERLEKQTVGGREAWSSTGHPVVFCTVAHTDGVYVFSLESTARTGCESVLRRPALAPVVRAIFGAESGVAAP